LNNLFLLFPQSEKNFKLIKIQLVKLYFYTMYLYFWHLWKEDRIGKRLWTE
jgi:hypothetical protein